MVDGVLIMNIELVKKQFVLFYPVAMEWIADNVEHIESYYVSFPHETEDTIHGNNCKFSIDICIYNGDRLTLDCSCISSSEYEFGALYSEPTLKHFNSWSGAGRLTDPYIKIGNDNINVFIERLNDELAKIIS
jgi:hypothetical protein